MSEAQLTSFGGLRRSTVIAGQIAENFKWLKAGGWDDLDTVLLPLVTGFGTRDQERECAARIGRMFTGIGPKQSRNFLQGLGLTRYEIPLDSRMIKWLKTLGKAETLRLLSSPALSDEDYYNCIMYAIQSLCAEANVHPCILDAAVFASFENE